MSTGPAERYAAAAHFVLHDRGGPHLVLLLHGLGGDSNQPLSLVADQLAGVGVSVLAPDARAHGDTPVIGGPDRFSTAALAADALALVDAIGFGGKFLIPVGISMGAAVALELVVRRRERVAGAVLIRPSFVERPWPDHLLVFKSIVAQLRSCGPAGALTFLHSPEYLAVRQISVSAANSLVEQFNRPSAVRRSVRLETVPGNVAVDWPGVLQVDRPVTIVAAERDPSHPQVVADLWHRKVAGSRLIVAPSRDDEPAGYTHCLEQAVVEAVSALMSCG